MKELEQKMAQYAKAIQDRRYPYGDDELDRSIRRAIWSREEKPSIQPPSKAKRGKWWQVAAAVAVTVTVTVTCLPTLRWGDEGDKAGRTKREIVFACNNGCDLEGTLAKLNFIIE